jgi:hypothetical protein
MRLAAATALVLVGCATTSQAALFAPPTARVLPETLLAVEVPAAWEAELTLVGSAGEITRWPIARADDGDRSSVVAFVRPGPSLRLRVRARGDDAPLQSFDAPLPLTGDEEAVLVDFVPEDGGGWTMQVGLVEAAPGVALTVRDPARVDLEIRNESDRAIAGIGFPAGVFDGWLVALAPAMRIVPRSRMYCGTGAVPFDPLAPGEATGSGPSSWAMMDYRHEPSPGEYAWIVELSADGWSRTIAHGSSGGAGHRVTRIAGAVARVVVP